MTITPGEFRERQSQLLDACKDLDLDALVVVANGSCFGLSGRSQGYMAFLCGWNSFDSPSALILRQSRPAELVVSHHRMMMMARENVPGVEVSWIDQDSFGTGLRRALTGSGSAPRRIGLCGWEDVIAKSWRSVETELSGVELIDIKDRFVPLRAIKSPAQRHTQRNAAVICDGMFDLLARSEVVGRFTYDIKAELERFAKRRGAEFVQHWMTVGSPPDYPRYFHHENRQVPKEGDLLIYGMQILVEGMWGHAVRTYSVGRASERHATVQFAAIDFQRTFMTLMNPGANMSDAVREGYKRMKPVYDAIGSSDVSLLRLGHGIGYSYGEPGISDAFPRSYYNLDDELARTLSIRFEAGMVFEIHPVFFFADGVAGVGDMIEIGADGPAFMTQFPRALCELRG